MATPSELLKSGKHILKNFREMFPMEVIENDIVSKGRKKKKTYWNELD